MRTSALQYLYLQKPVSSVIIICAIALLPWIHNDYCTKGEPREASVAVSMIESGNWILPKVYANEFAYKPPMAHWLMAACSLPQGKVSEFTSRLPSAIAQVALIGMILFFFGERTRFQQAFIATLLLLTSFEIHRAGMTARVDMLLTTFIVAGLIQLYRWEDRLSLEGLPFSIPILLSCAVLTKGPVGLILPLFIFFIYLLVLRKHRFLKIFKTLFYVGVSSMFIPLLWYVAAYRQGGEDFLNVMLAENFGRFFHLSESKITYDLGHKEGLSYNFITLLAGFIPWSLLLAFSLFSIKWRFPKKTFRQFFEEIYHRLLSMEKVKLFSLIALVCIIFFYSIPSSKRSVYLMPAYPFISLFLAQLFIYITEYHSKITRAFGYVFTTIVSVVFVVAVLMATRLMDVSTLVARWISDESTLHTVNIIADAFAAGSVVSWFILIMLAGSIITVIYQMTKRINIKILYATIFVMLCVNFFIDGIVMKSIREHTSAQPFAKKISREYDITDDNVYVMNSLRKYRNLYAMNFYMGNTFRNFEEEQPESGYFLTIEKDIDKIMERYGSRYQFKQLAMSEYQGDIRSKAILLEFQKSY